MLFVVKSITQLICDRPWSVSSFGLFLPWSCSLQLSQNQDSLRIWNSPCFVPTCELPHLPFQSTALPSSPKIFLHIPYFLLSLFSLT
jgi:hypothetical protein